MTDGQDELKEHLRKQNDEFAADIERKMTYERASHIWKLTRDSKNTVQDIAEIIHKQWGTDALWTPANNKVAGEILCLKAGEKLCYMRKR